MVDLGQDVKYIKGVGPNRATLLNKLGIYNLGDLITYYPREHEDRSKPKKIENVVVHCQAANAYTTCMWHNLINCVILYDKNGRLEAAKKRFNVPYPKKLKKAIIKRQIQLMDSAMPAYKVQISKAVKRGDLISVNHRVTEFLASYFDLLFALNEKTHIGEKRLVEWCKNNCMILPEYFEQNINNLFCHMYCENQSIIINDVNRIIECVKKVIKNEIEE